MKKLMSLILLMVSLFSVSACSCEKKVSFSYFQEKVNSIEGYGYYTIKQSIYNEQLLLYENEKNVYIDEDISKVVINSKQINDIDSEDLYSYENEEYYLNENTLYYFEDDSWKSKEFENSESGLGIAIEKNMFSSYKTKNVSGRKTFKGEIKNESISEFLGFEIDEVSDMVLSISVNKNGYVTSVCLDYLTNTGNEVKISLTPNYSYEFDLTLPNNE